MILLVRNLVLPEVEGSEDKLKMGKSWTYTKLIGQSDFSSSTQDLKPEVLMHFQHGQISL